MEHYKTVLKKYAEFNGRASRAEYWYFVLFNVIISIAISIIESILGLSKNGSGFLSWFYSLAILIPTLAVAIRRMHDVNKSGWFILIPIYNLILAITEGTKGSNGYGNDPYAPLNATETDSVSKIL